MTPFNPANEHTWPEEQRLLLFKVMVLAALADGRVQRDEEAIAYARRLTREEGILSGISSGAAVAAMLDVAKGLDRGVIVTVFPDGAEKYLNEPFWGSHDDE